MYDFMSNFPLSFSDIVLYPESKYLAFFSVIINPIPINRILKIVIGTIIGVKFLLTICLLQSAVGNARIEKAEGFNISNRR